MPRVTRLLHKVLALLAPTAVSMPMARAPAAFEATPVPTFSALVRQLGEQPAMRARFAREPRAVLREAGLDPQPFDIGETLTEAEVHRLIERWRTAQAVIDVQGPGSGSSEPGGTKPPPLPPADRASPPAAIYGPPPGFRPPPGPDTSQRPSVPAPVYGPPPGR